MYNCYSRNKSLQENAKILFSINSLFYSILYSICAPSSRVIFILAFNLNKYENRKSYIEMIIYEPV